MKRVVERFEELKQVPDYKSIINTNKEFTDKQFPPKGTSLFSQTRVKFDKAKKDKWKNRVKWRRIQDIYDVSDIEIVKDVGSQDVEQGDIGDCYFMSTISSLAFQQPYLIKKMFITK